MVATRSRIKNICDRDAQLTQRYNNAVNVKSYDWKSSNCHNYAGNRNENYEQDYCKCYDQCCCCNSQSSHHRIQYDILDKII